MSRDPERPEPPKRRRRAPRTKRSEAPPDPSAPAAKALPRRSSKKGAKRAAKPSPRSRKSAVEPAAGQSSVPPAPTRKRTSEPTATPGKKRKPPSLRAAPARSREKAPQTAAVAPPAVPPAPQGEALREGRKLEVPRELPHGQRLAPAASPPEESRPARRRQPGARAVSRDEILTSFEQRPLLEPPYPVKPPRLEPGGAPRRLAFVLHAHLPWVLGHGTWPHGEDWLAEAITHCYLPLLDTFRRLAARGRTGLATMSVTPVLAAMLADPRTPPLVDRYLTERTRAAWEARTRHPLALWWHGEYERLRALWDSFDHDLVRALRELSDREAIELSTSAGTHVYLPLAHTRKLVRLALRTGRETHRAHFGTDPRGCWMPECAYRPGGPWRHPVTGATEEDRPGNEEFLAEQGLYWTVLDAHLLRAGDPAFPYLSDLAPEEVAEPSGPHPKPYWIRRSSVAAFLRDARSAAQVWSRHGGYPGDANFLDFHKRHWPSGLRFWRVTGPTADLADKLVYWPEDAAARAREQAEHFVSLVGGLEGVGGGVVCAPFDAELFGHWWFEGPVWLERVLELTAPGAAVEATTPSRELDAGPSLRRAFFAEGSWGAGGDHSVWVNPDTEWFWRELADCERRAFAAVRWGGSRAWRRAVLNQMLLAAASDWPFLVTMGTGRDYAEQRFREHVARLRQLIDLGPRSRQLPDWVAGDLPFPEIEVEWGWDPDQ